MAAGLTRSLASHHRKGCGEGHREQSTGTPDTQQQGTTSACCPKEGGHCAKSLLLFLSMALLLT